MCLGSGPINLGATCEIATIEELKIRAMNSSLYTLGQWYVFQKAYWGT